MADFEQAKAYLKYSEVAGESLYDHLTSLILKITQEKPAQPLKIFENLSAIVKETSFKPDVFQDSPSIPEDAQSKKQLDCSIQQKSNLLMPPKPCKAQDNADEEEEEEEEAVATAELPDLHKQQSMFHWAGVRFSEEETLFINIALAELSKQFPSIQTIRFFGKFFGLKNDYYVAETKLKEYPEMEIKDPESKLEDPGTGANEHVYFVLTNFTSKWVKLPDVAPEQIIAARLVRKFLTGDLQAPVPGYPRFRWPEASYLRAQISRIVAATVLVPSGFYKMDEDAEDDPSMIEDEDFAPQPPTALLEPANWVHHRNGLLTQGRIIPYTPPEKDDDEEEPEENKEDVVEEAIPPLGSIENDLTPGLSKLWTLSVSPVAPKNSPHSVAVARSLTWPGAFSVANGRDFASIYVGNGMKYIGELYTPVPPPALQAVWQPPKEDPEEVDEDEELKAKPHPLTEQPDVFPPPPEEKKDDNDDENEDDED